MALTDAVINAGVDGTVTVMGWAAIHDGPGAGDQVSAERVAVVWDPATGRVAAAGNVPLAFTGAPGGAATRLGIWSAESAGTFRGSAPLVGAQAFNSAGQYSVTAVTTTGVDQTS